MLSYKIFSKLYFQLLDKNLGNFQKTIVEIYQRFFDKGKKVIPSELFFNLPSELSLGLIDQFKHNAWGIIMDKLVASCPYGWFHYVEFVKTGDGKVLYYLTDLNQEYQKQLNEYNRQLQQYAATTNYIQQFVQANPYLPANQLPQLPPQPQLPCPVTYYFDYNNLTQLDWWFCMSSYLSILPVLFEGKKTTKSYNP
jgi:hypothetical protein